MNPEDRSFQSDKLDLTASYEAQDAPKLQLTGIWPRDSSFVFPVGTTISTVIGTVLMITADNIFEKTGAGILIFFGLVQTIVMCRYLLFSLRRQYIMLKQDRPLYTNFIERAGTIQAGKFELTTNKSQRQLLTKAAKHRSKMAAKAAAEKVMLDEAEQNPSAFDEMADSLQAQATVFYVGLAVGIIGACIGGFGMWANYYPSILTGSIIASVGFVTVACALISAEHACETV